MIRTRSACALAAAALLALAPCPSSAQTQGSAPASAILFENVRVFDGRSDALTGPTNVLVVGSVIETLSTGPIETPEGTRIVRWDDDEVTLMPGLIDAHVHLMFSSLSQTALLTAELGFVNLVAGRGATEMLLRGFTSVRDLGGPVFGLKRAIDQGVIPGPRVWPSGAL